MRKIFFGSLVFLLGLVFLVKGVLAQDNQRQPAVILPEGQTTAGDYFASASSVVIRGTVNGDGYVAAGEVLMTGTVNEDLLVAGGMVTVSGRVLEDVRVAGGQVIIAGEVGGNVTAVGGSITLAESARINGGLVIAGGNAMILSPIGKGINLAAGRVTIANSVGGGVFGMVGQLVLAPGADIADNIRVASQSDLQVQPGAQVRGTISRQAPPPPTDQRKVAGVISGLALILVIIDLVSSLALGLFLLWRFPAWTQAIVNAVFEKPLAVLGLGLLVLILIPIIVMVLFLIIVGIPLALIILALFLIALYLTKVFVALVLGELILKKAARGWALLLGLIIYEILTLIPFVGPLVVFLTVLFGLGAIALVNRKLLF